MADFSMKQSLSSHTSEEEQEDGEEEELEAQRGGVEAEEDYEVSKPPTSPVSTPLMAPVTLPSSPTSATRSGRRSSSRSAVGLLSPSQAPSTASRKPRGRPPGSKNKPKPPIYITRETEPAMKTQQLEIPAGCDVVEMVQKFARKHRVGVHVVNGSGSVSNFTLRQPAITLSGAFNLLSLSGTFMGSSVCSAKDRAAPPSSAPWLAIFVGGSAGEVFGGTVIGNVIAASNVLLNVSTFGNYEFHRVDPGEYEEEEEEDERQGSSRGRLAGKLEGCSVSTGVGAIGFAVPAEHLNWAPPNVATRPPNHHF